MIVTLVKPDTGKSKFHRARELVHGILANLRTASTLKAAEEALNAVSDVLDLPWSSWTPDTSHPYLLPEIDTYLRSRGWPDELLSLWWNRNAPLKMPFHIRCRFEHFPFVVSLDHSKRRRIPDRPNPYEARITAIMIGMGITSFLVLPLHLPKGQVAMIVWSGSRKASELTSVVRELEGDLLAIGYHFMRIASQVLHQSFPGGDERSRLTPREWDCARTLAQGYREAEIAELFGIKKVTVRFHLDNVVKKFGCKTRAQTIALLAQLGLLGPIGT